MSEEPFEEIHARLDALEARVEELETRSSSPGVCADVLYPPGRLADLVEVPAEVISQAIDRGELRALSAGGRWRIVGRDFEQWAERNARRRLGLDDDQ
jgi:excisionase family DNA binding protein